MTEGSGAARASRLVALLDERERRAGPLGTGSPVELLRAPGRVNLIGEHTDYNEGWVLPAAIDLEIWIALRPWEQPRVELTSVDLASTATFAFDELAPRNGRPGSWIDYVAGVAWAAIEADRPIRGFRGVLDSTLPIGSGLASSAAIEMAAARALLDPRAERFAPAALARIGRRCENAYVGVQSGIMDQFASAAGMAGHALLLDCRDLEYRHVPLPEGLAIVVCDTGSPRRLEASQYNERWADCMEGVRLLAAVEPAVRALRDVDAAMLQRHRDRLPERVWRRSLHVVQENGRVIETVAGLEAGDRTSLGRLFAASHASLRDLYDVVSPELDAMVGIALGVPGVIAARMTGAGFGGCTVNIVDERAVDALGDAVRREYPAATGLTPRVFVTRAVDGAGPLPREVS